MKAAAPSSSLGPPYFDKDTLALPPPWVGVVKSGDGSSSSLNRRRGFTPNTDAPPPPGADVTDGGAFLLPGTAVFSFPTIKWRAGWEIWRRHSHMPVAPELVAKAVSRNGTVNILSQ
jgi:hypothetical protein